MCVKIMEDQRGKNMNDRNTDQLLKLLDDLIKLVGKNVDNINDLAKEIAELKEGKK
jgi:cell division septum initiation protein DivIVA